MTSSAGGVISPVSGYALEACRAGELTAVALASGLGSPMRLLEKPGLLTTEMHREMGPDAVGSLGTDAWGGGGGSSWAQWKSGIPTKLGLRGAEVPTELSLRRTGIPVRNGDHDLQSPIEN